MSKRKARSKVSRQASGAALAPRVRAANGRLPAWTAAAVLVLLIAVVYGPALKSPLIFDDIGAIVENESIKSLWPLVGFNTPGPLNPPPEFPTSGRPLVNLSFAINYYLGGFDPSGFHVVNIVLHFFSSMILWAIVRRALRLPYFGDEFAGLADWLALMVAMLWSLHPLQTEAVIYATQRTELMMAFFYLGTLYCSLRYWSSLSNRNGRTTWLALAAIACLCGMACKEVMVSAPLMVLLFERAFVAGSLSKALKRSWPLYVALGSTWMLLAFLSANAPHRDAAGFHLGPAPYVWWFTQAKVLLMYLKLVLWPSPLLIHYQIPYFTSFADAWMYVLSVLFLGIVASVLLWRNTPLGYLATWVFAILSPTSLIPIVTEMAAERRMYLALAALAVIAVVGGYRLAEAVLRPRDASMPTASPTLVFSIGIPAVLLTLVLCLLSATRLTAYENEMNLWMEVLALQPNDYMARQSIGSYLERSGDDSAAMEQFREAIRLNPDASLSHYSLALLLNKRGAHDEAAAHFAEAARIIPNNAVLRNNLAFALYMAGRNDEAIDTFHAALALDPDNWLAHKNLGTALQKAGRYQESIGSFETALRLNPKAIDIYGDLAKSYTRMDQRPQAIAMLEQGLDLARAAGDAEQAKIFAAAIETNQ